MKTGFALGAIAAGLLLSGSTGVAQEWTSDFEAALKASAETGRPILADFTGSDWCPWCLKLDSEVFSTDEFRKFAKDNVILFVADFPNEKQLPPALVAQNKKLAEKYSIQGFPTVLILDSKGKELGRTGYRRGGAVAYVEHLKSLLPQSK